MMFIVFSFKGGDEDILEVVTDLARCCSDALKVIQGLKSKVAVSQLEEEVCLEKERNTWRLLFSLYQDRLAALNLMEEDGKNFYCVLEILLHNSLNKNISIIHIKFVF